MRRLAPADLWTASVSAAADRHTIDDLGMPSAVLMERAALCVSAEVERVAAASDASEVLVLCGPGNNGGDGLAVARQLHVRGRRVRACVVTPEHNAAVADQLELARRHGVELLDVLPSRPSRTCVIVDALLGTGSRGAPRGPVLDALEWMRQLDSDTAPIIAIDVPTGVDVDSGAVPGRAVRASVTVTFQRSKPGLHVTPGREHAGEVVVADIGLIAPADRLVTTEDRVELIEPAAVARALTGLPPATHKGMRGHVGVIGGSGGTPGAAILSGTGALRAGAGLVTLAGFAAELRSALVQHRPELMLAIDEHDWSIPEADVLVVGPGMTDARQLDRLPVLDGEDPRSMVWDASGLEGLGHTRSAGARVITPHPGEAARLLARLDPSAEWTTAQVQADRCAAARTLARVSGATVVLKGEGTLVADRSRVAICTTGGPALATAGSGDVLAGAIAALLARGLETWQAACVGVHLHGLAGDRSPANGSLALDIANAFTGAMRLAADGTGQAIPGRWPALVRG